MFDRTTVRFSNYRDGLESALPLFFIHTPRIFRLLLSCLGGCWWHRTMLLRRRPWLDDVIRGEQRADRRFYPWTYRRVWWQTVRACVWWMNSDKPVAGWTSYGGFVRH